MKRMSVGKKGEGASAQPTDVASLNKKIKQLYEITQKRAENVPIPIGKERTPIKLNPPPKNKPPPLLNVDNLELPSNLTLPKDDEEKSEKQIIKESNKETLKERRQSKISKKQNDPVRGTLARLFRVSNNLKKDTKKSVGIDPRPKKKYFVSDYMEETVKPMDSQSENNFPKRRKYESFSLSSNVFGTKSPRDKLGKKIKDDQEKSSSHESVESEEPEEPEEKEETEEVKETKETEEAGEIEETRVRRKTKTGKSRASSIRRATKHSSVNIVGRKKKRNLQQKSSGDIASQTQNEPSQDQQPQDNQSKDDQSKESPHESPDENPPEAPVDFTALRISVGTPNNDQLYTLYDHSVQSTLNMFANLQSKSRNEFLKMLALSGLIKKIPRQSLVITRPECRTIFQKERKDRHYR